MNVIRKIEISSWGNRKSYFSSIFCYGNPIQVPRNGCIILGNPDVTNVMISGQRSCVSEAIFVQNQGNTDSMLKSLIRGSIAAKIKLFMHVLSRRPLCRNQRS